MRTPEDSMPFADQIDVFYGRVTHSSAQVYVRVSPLAGGSEWSIAGHVRGPLAHGTRTLPTTVALSDLGAGPTLLATCSIPDPAFWTAQLPCVYEVNVQLRYKGEVVETVIRSLGIRFLGASGRNFLWQGKRWVLRGVAAQVSDAPELEVLRENGGVLVTGNPSATLLDEASSNGVLVVAELSSDDLIRDLRRLSHSPAVAIVILPSECGAGGALRTIAPNLLLAERVDPSRTSKPAEWAYVSFVDETNVNVRTSVPTQWPLPVILERRLSGNYTLLEARRQCDQLQRDFAPLGDFAGYVVHVEWSALGSSQHDRKES